MALTWAYRIGGTGTTLTAAQRDNNILCIYGAMSGYGFSTAAIAGMCGCFFAESGFNPGIYETSHGGNLNNLPYFPGGMGLAQWTDYPAYSGTYPNPLPWSADKEGRNWYDGNFQCWLLTQAANSTYTAMGYGQGARWGWQQSSTYPSISFDKYKTFSGTPEDACKYWFFCFEWHYYDVPADYLTLRYKWARYAYDLILGKEPVAPDDSGGGGGSVTPPGTTLTDAQIAYILHARRRRKNGKQCTFLLRL